MNNFTTQSYPQVLSRVSQSAKALLLSDLKLINAELKELGRGIKDQTKHIAIYGYIFAVSAIPFLIFGILLLGEMLNQQYWLSSLIIGILCFFVGLIGATIAYRKLKNLNYKLSKTRTAIKREGEVIYQEIEKLQALSRETLKEEGRRAIH